MFEQGLQALCTPILGGIGSVLMLHRVVQPPLGPRLANVDIETPIAHFVRILEYLTTNGFELVSLDEVRNRLENPRSQKRRFVALTFDDGYRDCIECAFPLCLAEGIPVALYVTSGFVDRTVAPWWYAVEDACLANQRVVVDISGQEHVWMTRTLEEKRAAHVDLDGIFRRLHPQAQQHVVEQLIGHEAAVALTDRLFVDWDELRASAACDLITIGAHTETHPVLRNLSETDARDEIRASRTRLEEELHIPIRHFAFPFGGAADISSREVRLARESGFDTATTTHMGNLFEEHREHMHALPRIYDRDHDLRRLGWLLSGIKPVLRSRGQRVVKVAQ